MLDWNQIKTVFLDMDGTLLDLNFDNFFWLELVPQEYAARHNLSINSAKSKLLQRYRAKQGQLEWYCVDYWSHELALDIIELKHKVRDKISLRPLVEEFLAAVKDKGKRRVLVTNAHQKTLALKLKKIPISHWFDKIISSHAIGFAKEDPKFWDELKRHENFELDSSLLIDDSKAVLDAASNYGFKHLLAIARPDLKQEPNPAEGFRALDCFKDIM